MHAARSVLRTRAFKSTSSSVLVPAASVLLAAVAAGASLSTPTHAESAALVPLPTETRRWSSWPRAATKQLTMCADVRQLYSVDRVIGRGGFGQVHRGRDRQSDSPVAIKRVSKQTTTRDKFLQEVSILRAVGGRANVVGLCEAFETSDAYVLVTELVDGEELFDHLVTQGVPAEARAQTLVRQLAQTLQYLHTHGVVHGDLKPENILLTTEAQRVKLIDFGQAFREHISSERTRCLASGVATVAYAAPEVIGSAAGPGDAGSAIDMWGLGVVLYIVLCGFHPFDPTNTAEDAAIAARIAAGAFETDAPEWRALSPAARDLVTRLLQVDPSRRISAGAVLAHEWLEPAAAE